MLDMEGTTSKILVDIDRDELVTAYKSLSDLTKLMEGWLKT